MAGIRTQQEQGVNPPPGQETPTNSLTNQYKLYNSAVGQQAEDYSDKIAYTIMYEELLKSPNKIQEEIAEKFNLDMAYKWSEYPSFMEGIKEKPQTQGGIYKLRAIGAKK